MLDCARRPRSRAARVAWRRASSITASGSSTTHTRLRGQVVEERRHRRRGTRAPAPRCRRTARPSSICSSSRRVFDDGNTAASAAARMLARGSAPGVADGLAHRVDVDRVQRAQRPLRGRVVEADRLDLVAEQLDADRVAVDRREEVDHRAAHRERPRVLDDRRAREAGAHQRARRSRRGRASCPTRSPRTAPSNGARGTTRRNSAAADATTHARREPLRQPEQRRHPPQGRAPIGLHLGIGRRLGRRQLQHPRGASGSSLAAAGGRKNARSLAPRLGRLLVGDQIDERRGGPPGAWASRAASAGPSEPCAPYELDDARRRQLPLELAHEIPCAESFGRGQGRDVRRGHGRALAIYPKTAPVRPWKREQSSNCSASFPQTGGPCCPRLDAPPAPVWAGRGSHGGVGSAGGRRPGAGRRSGRISPAGAPPNLVTDAQMVDETAALAQALGRVRRTPVEDRLGSAAWSARPMRAPRPKQSCAAAPRSRRSRSTRSYPSASGCSPPARAISIGSPARSGASQFGFYNPSSRRLSVPDFVVAARTAPDPGARDRARAPGSAFRPAPLPQGHPRRPAWPVVR